MPIQEFRVGPPKVYAYVVFSSSNFERPLEPAVQALAEETWQRRAQLVGCASFLGGLIAWKVVAGQVLFPVAEELLVEPVSAEASRGHCGVAWRCRAGAGRPGPWLETPRGAGPHLRGC